ncbi:hypothetical protein I2I05_05335 [Hymenobacter sp. BT683]|uniref:Transcriptional regulator n=1 Tax=Hymenobacter jeongseonensis TaxID=2791027 RepID=A0ABS0IEP7_9BACT|nr:hypothetical protein [Hymenobacter jeongseonensis]MBF9236812.1 hypothetical protein [Hymenobacter jeongseonensis]
MKQPLQPRHVLENYHQPQLDFLAAHPAEQRAEYARLFRLKAAGALAARVELDEMLVQLRLGDTVYIHKLDLVADLYRRGMDRHPSSCPTPNADHKA